jgi:hypothetical protein
MAIQEVGAIIRPRSMRQIHVAVLLEQVAALATSAEYVDANPLLDEWIMLARAIADVM